MEKNLVWLIIIEESLSGNIEEAVKGKSPNLSNSEHWSFIWENMQKCRIVNASGVTTLFFCDGIFPCDEIDVGPFSLLIL